MILQENELLTSINERIKSTSAHDIPLLFKDVSLQLFGELSLQKHEGYENIKNWFPEMPCEEIQINWTGTHGDSLLFQSIAFVRSVVDFYKSLTGTTDLSKINLLDFGCGWGRLIRLFYKYIPENQIYGVDAWDISLQICKDYGVRANFEKIDDICKKIPFNEKFDIIIAFSIFTHLSEKTATYALNAIRKSIKDDGILVLTVRPFDYWQIHANQWDSTVPVKGMVQKHIREGFVFVPHKREAVEGEVTFGDTSISIEYIMNRWTDWKIIDYKINLEDPYQALVFLQPKS